MEEELAHEMNFSLKYAQPKIKNKYKFETNLKDYDHSSNEYKQSNFAKTREIKNA
tara:strand:+ start:216 stop:380 length:165 start_codon:yes stop_codon:yes gene_type:complete